MIPIPPITYRSDDRVKYTYKDFKINPNQKERYIQTLRR